jgi:hypothetical protein
MSKLTSTGRKSFKVLAVAGTTIIGLGGAALLSGVSPAMAANLAQQPDAQVAVFMVPLTLLVLAMVFEATKFVWRDRVPATEVANRRPKRSIWTNGKAKS